MVVHRGDANRSRQVDEFVGGFGEFDQVLAGDQWTMLCGDLYGFIEKGHEIEIGVRWVGVPPDWNDLGRRRLWRPGFCGFLCTRFVHAEEVAHDLAFEIDRLEMQDHVKYSSTNNLAEGNTERLIIDGDEYRRV